MCSNVQFSEPILVLKKEKIEKTTYFNIIFIIEFLQNKIIIYFCSVKFVV